MLPACVDTFGCKIALVWITVPQKKQLHLNSCTLYGSALTAQMFSTICLYCKIFRPSSRIPMPYWQMHLLTSSSAPLLKRKHSSLFLLRCPMQGDEGIGLRYVCVECRSRACFFRCRPTLCQDSFASYSDETLDVDTLCFLFYAAIIALASNLQDWQTLKKLAQETCNAACSISCTRNFQTHPIPIKQHNFGHVHHCNSCVTPMNEEQLSK